jgi:D-threo-aldose 1-dehydrogenase
MIIVLYTLDVSLSISLAVEMIAIAQDSPSSAEPITSRLVKRSGQRIGALGFGAASLGNLYHEITDADAFATVEAALAVGISYFDTAPLYGFGLSERRLGDVLRGRPNIMLSTKAGRLLRPLPEHRGTAQRQGFCTPMPFEPFFDYSHDAILRSHEQSLQRLGLAKIDILYVHDIGALTHGEGHTETFAQLTTGGGFRALERLRSEGTIGAFGLGVNEWQVCMQAMQHADLDAILLAGRYTLLEQEALDIFLPACVKRDIAVVIGGAYNSGILATGTRRGTAHYDYAPAPTPIVERVAQIEDVCGQHGVTLAAAALQFPLAHPSVVSVIPGIGNPERVRQTLAIYQEAIPGDFWAELQAEGLLRADAPVPVQVTY